MNTLNIEIKARSNALDKPRNILLARNAEFKGTDYQTDTYFNVPDGRLKLREGNIENKLIFYKRSDKSGPKESDVILYDSKDATTLKAVLKQSVGVTVVVEKKREIYYIDNIKFHLDNVKGLGSFIEIEANDKSGTIIANELHKQCKHYMKLFNINEDHLVKESYSDLILKKQSNENY